MMNWFDFVFGFSVGALATLCVWGWVLKGLVETAHKLLENFSECTSQCHEIIELVLKKDNE